MNTTHYDPAKLEILEYIENGNPRIVPDFAEKMQRMRLSVAQKITKRKPVNLRILESDLAKLKSQARQQGIPYQTLVSSIVHQYVNGDLAKSGVLAGRSAKTHTG